MHNSKFKVNPNIIQDTGQYQKVAQSKAQRKKIVELNADFQPVEDNGSVAEDSQDVQLTQNNFNQSEELQLIGNRSVVDLNFSRNIGQGLMDPPTNKNNQEQFLNQQIEQLDQAENFMVAHQRDRSPLSDGHKTPGKDRRNNQQQPLSDFSQQNIGFFPRSPPSNTKTFIFSERQRDLVSSQQKNSNDDTNFMNDIEQMRILKNKSHMMSQMQSPSNYSFKSNKNKSPSRYNNKSVQLKNPKQNKEEDLDLNGQLEKVLPTNQRGFQLELDTESIRKPDKIKPHRQDQDSIKFQTVSARELPQEEAVRTRGNSQFRDQNHEESHNQSDDKSEMKMEETLQVRNIPVKNKALAFRLQEAAKKLRYVKVIDEMRGMKRKKTWMVESSSEDEADQVILKQKRDNKQRDILRRGTAEFPDQDGESDKSCCGHERGYTTNVQGEADQVRRTSKLDQKRYGKKRKFQGRSQKVAGFINIEDASEIESGAALRFKQYGEQFMNMTQRTYHNTEWDVVSVLITYDSKNAIVLLQETDQKYYVRIYELETTSSSPTHVQQHAIEGALIKAYAIEQNDHGHYFCIPYLDSGVFWLLIFNKHVEVDRVNLTRLIKLDSQTSLHAGVTDPLICACFVKGGCSDESIFVNLFQKEELCHYHFLYSHKDKSIVEGPVRIRLNCSDLNFPQEVFFDQLTGQVHCFYRQGQTFAIDVKDMAEYKFQQLDCQDLAQMYFVYNKVIIARCSDQVLFFKQIEEVEGERTVKSWHQYHAINERGFIFYMRGNKQVQITSDRLIYFYNVDPMTLEPRLENCMYNFMGCTQVMFGPRSRYSITYKVGQIGFDVYRRKYHHKYMVKANSENFEGCNGASLNSKQLYMIFKNNRIIIYDQNDFRQIEEILVPFEEYKLIEKSDEKQMEEVRLQIQSIQVSLSQNMLAVLIGNTLVSEETQIHQLVVYHSKQGEWTLRYNRELRFDIMDISKCFHFNRSDINELILTNSRRIIGYNYYNERVRDIHVFQNYLNAQPLFAEFNGSQSVAIISTFYDVLYVDILQDMEIDIDKQFEIGDIRSIVHVKEKEKFYVLANKCERLLGYYLIEIDDKPPIINEPVYLINWKSKLDIANANLFLLENEEDGTQRIVVSYKSIYINTYNVMVICLKHNTIIYRYETFHIWESTIRGIILKNYDYVMISKDGTFVMSLGYQEKRKIRGSHGTDQMLHTLDSCRDLRLEETNHLMFLQKDNGLVISLQEQYQDQQGETMFENIYKVNVQEMTLRELLLSQSVFSCRQQYDIVKLIELQPQPAVFFKSFLELEKSNLMQILSFDSRSIGSLLDEKHSHLFQSEYPLFYRTKHHSTKSYSESAIDTAIQNNQIRAVKQIIDYIIKHQNSYVYSYLFENNLVSIIEKGIEITDLLNSDVFCHRFDYQEWPAMHLNDEHKIAKYNDSMFKLRGNYETVFPEISRETQIFKAKGKMLRRLASNLARSVQEHKMKDQRVFKIKYTLNILPSINLDEDDDTLMNAVCRSPSLEIFDSKALEDLLSYKWNTYAKYLHHAGLISHLIYTIVFSIFVCETYVYKEQPYEKILYLCMLLCLLYPLSYDMTQLKKQGLKYYLSDMWNLFDQCHIWCGFMNIYLQQKLDDGVDTTLRKQIAKIFMIIVTYLMLVKTFFFMRVFRDMSQLVMMMRQVIYDLRVFMMFYFILIWIISLVFNILMVGNYRSFHDSQQKDIKNSSSGYPGKEYQHLWEFVGQFFTIIRISLGDFDFGYLQYMEEFEVIMFWIIWLVIVMVTCIIFLNFIIAEVSSSYEKVKVSMNSMFLQERANLICESEDMMFPSMRKNRGLFPKYLITREVEE